MQAQNTNPKPARRRSRSRLGRLRAGMASRRSGRLDGRTGSRFGGSRRGILQTEECSGRGASVKVKVINPVRVSSAFDRTYPDGSQFVHVKDADGKFYMGDVKAGQALADADWTLTYPLSGEIAY